MNDRRTKCEATQRNPKSRFIAYFRDECTARTWLSTIVRNAGLDAIRKRARRPQPDVEIDALHKGGSFQDGLPLHSEKVEFSDAVVELRRTIERLPARQRAALLYWLNHDEFEPLPSYTTAKLGRFRGVESLKTMVHTGRAKALAAHA